MKLPFLRPVELNSHNFSSYAWTSGVQLTGAAATAVLRAVLFDSSGSETESDTTFKTPPASIKTTVVWETKQDQ